MPSRKPCHQFGVFHYQIRIEGELDPCWSEWFDGMTITSQGNETILAGLTLDQPALYGLLKRIRDLGLALVAVERVIVT